MRRFTPTTRVAARKSARVSDAVTIAAPPRHTPTGAPGGLPHHALAGALVFRRPRRPRPARGQQPHVDGASPLRARAARAAAAEIRPGAFCALHSAATPHEDPVTTTDADFSCAARRLWRASLYPAMDQCQRAPTPAASFSAAPCPRRLCPWGPPRHTPTGAPGGLPHHALAGALVFRRPRRRRTRPPRGQQPHAQGPGRSRCRHRNSFGLAHCAPSSSGARAADELALLVDNSPTPTAQAR